MSAAIRSIAVRRATHEDFAAIAAIQASSPGASQWEPSSYLEHDCWVAIEAGEVAGFMVARETAPGEREILNVAVDPARRRCGIARRLLVEELSRPKTQWFLEVRESNAGARGLYESLGFRVAGRRRNYYAESLYGPPEDGIVMRFFS